MTNTARLHAPTLAERDASICRMRDTLAARPMPSIPQVPMVDMGIFDRGAFAEARARLASLPIEEQERLEREWHT